MCIRDSIYVAIEVLSGTVQGAGASFIPMIISISNLCVLRVILLAIVVPLWNSVPVSYTHLDVYKRQ